MLILIIVLFAISVLFGVLRFVVPVSGKINKADIFKDLAHIWVGVLIGAGIGASVTAELSVELVALWALPVLLTVLEVVAFVVRKK